MESTPANALGLTLPIASSPEGITIGGAHLIREDAQGTDGVVHVIDEVLLP
jgi:uncharacterized surface protein with fasciclin (FAS1) repeats